MGIARKSCLALAVLLQSGHLLAGLYITEITPTSISYSSSISTSEYVLVEAATNAPEATWNYFAETWTNRTVPLAEHADSEFVQFRLRTSDSPVHLRGAAAVSVNSNGVGVICAYTNGEKLVSLDSAGTTQPIDGVQWFGPEGQSAHVYCDEIGRPTRAVLGDDILMYTNYTESTVDVAHIRPDGTVSVHRGVALPNSAQQSLAASAAEYSLSRELTLREEIRFASLVASTALCVGAIVMSSGLAFPCAAAVVTFGLTVLPEDNAALEGSSIAIGAIGCGLHDAGSCITLTLDTAGLAAGAAESLIEENREGIDEANNRLSGPAPECNKAITMYYGGKFCDMTGPRVAYLGDTIRVSTGQCDYQVSGIRVSRCGSSTNYSGFTFEVDACCDWYSVSPIYASTTERGNTSLPATAPYITTPMRVVDEVLGRCSLTPTDVVYDLGCGDGRFLVSAASRYGCSGVGVEIDPTYVALARANALTLGVESKVSIIEADVLTVGLSDATCAIVCLSPGLNEALAKSLQSLKPGSRVCSIYFPIPGLPLSERFTVLTTAANGVGVFGSECDTRAEFVDVYLYEIR